MTPILLVGDTVKGFLPDATSCVVTEERNGIFELELTYPVAGPMFGELAVDRYIKAKPNDTADLQLFRIYEITKPIAGIVTVRCEHVSYALAHYPVTDVSGTGTPTEAVGAVLAKVNAYLTLSHAFHEMETGWATTKAYQYKVGSARAALGGSEGSVLDTFGGEFEWDNYDVRLHQHRGSDTGVVVAYRKNMTDLKVTTSLDSAYTALFPYAIKDDVLVTVTGGKITVTNSSGIADRVLIRDFSSEFQGDEEVNATTLRAKADAYLAENDINAPSVHVSVSFVNLWQSPEYADLAALERVSLCDWVTVRHDILGVDVKAQVIKTEYDCIAERYNQIELGSACANLQDTLQQTIHDVTKLLQSTDTSAITQAYMQAIADATDLITGADGGYVHLIPSHNPQEIVISDVEDYTLKTAKVWRWNKNGLGYSSTGYSGKYATAITKDGKINASMMTTGTLNASIITAGVLQSADGTSSFNLENGLITSSNINVTGGTIKIGSGEYYTYIANGSVEQHAKDGNLIGGLVPVASGDIYAQALYYDPSTSDSIDFSYRNPDGNFESIMQLKSDSITAHKDFSFCGKVLSDISLSGEYGLKLNDKYVLRNYKGSVSVGSDTDSLTLYGTSVTTDATISCANLLVGGKEVLTEIPSILSVSCLYASETITIGGKPVLTGIPSNLSVDCLYASGTITVGGKPVLTDIPSMIDCTGINASNYINVGGKPVLTSLPSSIDCHSVVFDAEKRGGTYSYIAGKTSETGLNIYDKNKIDIYGGSSRIGISDSGITVNCKIIPESGSTCILGSLSNKFYQVSTKVMVADQYLALKGDTYNVVIQYFNGNLCFGAQSQELYLYGQNVYTTCNLLPSSSEGASLGDSTHLFYSGYFGYDVYIGSSRLSVNNAISRLYKAVKSVASKVGVSVDLPGDWKVH